MQRLLRSETIQAKLTVNKPGDEFEQEADRMADQVMRMSDSAGEPQIQRMCSGCDQELQTKDPASAPGNENVLTLLERGSAAVQRMCDDCEEEAGAAIENDDEEKVMLKAADAETTRPASPIEANALSALSGGGQPLALSTRRFFEDRMGRDFRNVRVHTDTRADEMARSLNALAFTRANHLVFRSDEYRPDTSAGRRILAHELAHTIQQGASPSAGQDPAAPEASVQRSEATADTSFVPAVQRVCDVTAPPGDLACPAANSSLGSGTPIRFGQDSSTINPADLGLLASIAAAWHTGGGVQMIRIDGFASCDGPPGNNWRLSCNRASAVRAELEAPTGGSPGVDPAFIEIAANGETDQFSATILSENRRALVSSGGTPPAGPHCPLTITGLDEVDHYCAAYVPSDAVSCGQFPAPPITLTAAGAAPRATLNWRISHGGARASIVGPLVGPSVDIQGDAQSATQGDVTAQVSDGTCTTTHHITVREPAEMTATEAPASGPTFLEDIITYTVLDQFGNAMGADICVDETITFCANNRPRVHPTFGDAPTDASGQVADHLRYDNSGGVPPTICIKSDQVITAGGCGPLMHNTILFEASGITLTHNDSCAAGDPCP